MNSASTNRSSSWGRAHSGPKNRGSPRAGASVDPEDSPSRGGSVSISVDAVQKVLQHHRIYSNHDLLPGITVRSGLANTFDTTPYGPSNKLSEQEQSTLWEEEVARLIDAVKSPPGSLCIAGFGDLGHDTKQGYEMLARLSQRVRIALLIAVQDFWGVIQRHSPDTFQKASFDECRGRLQRFLGEDRAEYANDEDRQRRKLATSDECSMESPSSLENFNEFVNYLTGTLARILSRAAAGQGWLANILAVLAKLSTKLKVLSFGLEKAVSNSLKLNSDVSANTATSQDRRTGTTSGMGTAQRGKTGARSGGRSESAAASLGDLDELFNTMLKTSSRRESSDPIGHDGLVKTMLMTSSRKASSDPTTKTRQRSLVSDFWCQSFMYGVSILTLLEHVIMGLKHRQGESRPSLSVTSYELSALVFDTNFSEFPTYIFQNNDGDWLGTSKHQNINIAHAAFEVLHEAVSSIDERAKTKRPLARLGSQPSQKSPSSPSKDTSQQSEEEQASLSSAHDPSMATGGAGEFVAGTQLRPVSLHEPLRATSVGTRPSDVVGTSVEWYYTDEEPSQSKRHPPTSSPSATTPQVKTTRLTCTSDVLSVMIGLRIANPTVVVMLTNFLLMWAYYGTIANPVKFYEAIRYKAFFSLTTQKYCRSWALRKKQPFSQLSRSLLRRHRLPEQGAGTLFPQLSTTGPRLPTHSTTETHVDEGAFNMTGEDMALTVDKMNEWVIEENGVRVRCELYVWTTLCLGASLVLGGIAAGITVGERLPGVDPFNITLFCWVVAGFAVLLAKSLRVAHWPWRDFLRRKVLCRSVSELHSVSGIDTQLILSRLLYIESASHLQTRGPYNTVFNRKAEGGADGFAIDVPWDMRTLLLSGLVMIQVRSYSLGEFLVCLDLREGTDYNVIRFENGPSREKKYLGSDKLSKDFQKVSARSRIPLILRESNDWKWSQVLGVYNQADCSFT